MGFNAFFVARIDHQDMVQRLKQKSINTWWDPPQASSISNGIFTEVNYNNYHAPPSFCFDQSCTDEPIIDDESNELYNVDRRS